MLPPAAPTTQLSIARIAVGRPITRSVRSTVRPSRTTETFELVPPHSTTIPARQRQLVQRGGDARRRPRADRHGRRGAERVEVHRAAVAAQHEQRRVEAGVGERPLDDRRGALHERQDAGVDRGRHRARLEAVGAGQLVAGAGRRGRGRGPAAATSSSCSGVSTANAALTASAWQPAATSTSIAASTARTSSPPVASMKTCSVRSFAPRRQRQLADRVRLRAPAQRRAPRRCRSRRPARRRPRAARSSPAWWRTRPARSTRPSPSRVDQHPHHGRDALADPARGVVRGRLRRPAASGCASPGTIAIAFVKVPPTSMPTRTGRRAPTTDRRGRSLAHRRRGGGPRDGRQANT